jgi:hypothetical protein
MATLTKLGHIEQNQQLTTMDEVLLVYKDGAGMFTPKTKQTLSHLNVWNPAFMPLSSHAKSYQAESIPEEDLTPAEPTYWLGDEEER